MKIILKLIMAITLFATISCKKENTTKEVETEQTLVEQNYVTEKPKVVKYGNEITATGLLSYKNEYQLSFMSNGILNYLNVDEGDYVKKGQLLASINQTTVKVMTDRLTLSYDKWKHYIKIK